MLRICAVGLVAALRAAAAGAQSPMAVIAVALRPLALATASATAMMPNSSAAGIESDPPPVGTVPVSAALSSAAWMSAGHFSDTSQTSPGLFASKRYPPTPSMPLASVVTVSIPGSSSAGNDSSGASATPTLSSSSSAATASSPNQSVCALLPVRRRMRRGRRRRPPACHDALVMAYPPCRTDLSSGRIWEMLTSRPTSVSARSRSTSSASRAASSCLARSASMDARLSGGQSIRLAARSMRSPSPMTGSPATTLWGAASRPTSLSPATVSCACTYTRVLGLAAVPPSDRTCSGPMLIPRTSSGSVTGSSSAVPMKSSMYTCRWLGIACACALGSSPRAWAARRSLIQRRAAGGGGCASSNAACFVLMWATTMVEMRSNLLGAKEPPKAVRRSTQMPALPSASHHKKHCCHRSASCVGQYL